MSIWQVLFSFDGRIPRKTYWLAYLGLMAGMMATMALGAYVMTGEGLTLKFMLFPRDEMHVWGPVLAGQYIIFLWPILAVFLKRWHDRNRPTWVFIVLYAVCLLPVAVKFAGYGPSSAELVGVDWTQHPMAYDPIGQIASLPCMLVGLYLFVELGCLRGTRGPNRYGEDPLPPEAHVVKPGFANWIFGLNGRISRSRWWLGLLVTTGIAIAVVTIFIVCVMLVMPFNDPAFQAKMQDPKWAHTAEGQAFFMKMGLVMIVPALMLYVPLWNLVALGVKRLHDQGASGWWIMLVIAPFFLAILSPGIFAGLPEPRQGAWIATAWTVYGLTVLWTFVQFGMLGGNQGENRFGPAPAG